MKLGPKLPYLAQLILLFALSLSLPEASGQEDTTWRVSGLYLGMPADQTKLFLQNHPELKAGFEFQGERSWSDRKLPVETSIRLNSSGTCVDCSGPHLSLGNRTLLKLGDHPRKAINVLGKPERISGLMGWCTEDPVITWIYKRRGAILVVYVTNPDFHTSKKFPNQIWGFSLGPIPTREFK